MDIINSLSFTRVEGIKASHHLRVFALTTCGFCERAMNYLKKGNYDFEYIYLDKIDPDTKRMVKQEMKDKYGKVPLYPVLIVDEEKMFSGFTESKWSEFIN